MTKWERVKLWFSWGHRRYRRMFRIEHREFKRAGKPTEPLPAEHWIELGLIAGGWIGLALLIILTAHHCTPL